MTTPACLMLLFLVPQDARGTPATPQAVSATLPPRAYSVGAAYDARRERLVVFGGKRPGPGYVSATWERGKEGWREVATDGPSPRNSPTLAYDEARGVTVLFGGDDRSGALGDTWEWDGSGWLEVTRRGESPPARTNARLAYDAKRGAVVLFGGIAGERVFGDAWAWDGEAWTLLASDGPPRFLHGFAATEQGWLVYGGSDQAPRGAPPPPRPETWLARQGAWSEVSGPGPGARDHVTLAYDPVRQRAVFHGGFLDGAPSPETWEFDGTTWTRAETKLTPGERGYPTLVFDSTRRRILLYGGFDANGPKNDLWSWDGERWTPEP